MLTMMSLFLLSQMHVKSLNTAKRYKIAPVKGGSAAHAVCLLQSLPNAQAKLNTAMPRRIMTSPSSEASV
jgi:hypothetical protein